MVVSRSLQIRSLLEVNEEFANKLNAADDALSQPKNLICCQKALDVVVSRSLQIRSLLEVNEEFANKLNAADDALSQQINIC